MQTVYVDVLVASNLLITWAMLRTCGELCRRKAGRGRMAAASLLGGASALLILLPELPGAVLAVFRLLLAMGLVRMAFRWEGWRMFFRMAGVLFMVSLLFAGGMAALWALFQPKGLAVHNGTVYFHIPAWALAGAATVGYLAARGMGAALEHRMPADLLERYTVRALGRSGTLTLLTDTGNRLTFSGRPVAVIGAKAAGFLPPEVAAAAEDLSVAAAASRAYPGNIQFVPCRTAAGEKLLPGVRATLTRERDGASFDCLLALTGADCFPAPADGKGAADGVIGVVN